MTSNLKQIAEAVIAASSRYDVAKIYSDEYYDATQELETLGYEHGESLSRAYLSAMERIEVLEGAIVAHKQVWQAPHGCLAECRRLCEALEKSRAIGVRE